MSAANAAYQQQLCSLLGVTDPATASAEAGRAASTQQASAANTPVAASTTSLAAQPAAAVTDMTAAEAEAGPTLAIPLNEQTSAQTSIVEVEGISFSVLLDLFSHYVMGPVSAAESAAVQEAATAAVAVATAKETAAAAALQAAHAASAASAEAATAAAAAAASALAAPAADAKVGSKEPKAKPAAAAGKAKEAVSAVVGKGVKGGKAAADDKAAAQPAAVEAPPPAPKFVFGGIAVPKRADGTALCQEDGVPADTARAALKALQVWKKLDRVLWHEAFSA